MKRLVQGKQAWLHLEDNRESRKRIGASWDTLIQDEAHCAKATRYVEANPVKAGSVREATAWPWRSTRLWDEYGRLPVPPNRSGRSAGLQPALDTHKSSNEQP